MIISLQALALWATFLALPAACAENAPNSADSSVSSLVASAKAFLAAGEYNAALTEFDAAITKDPSNYLTIFQRGATYLSIGRNAQASADFDKVLSIKPDFEGALVQRAKIKARSADWAAARDDYTKAGKGASEDMIRVEEAKTAAALAVEAEKKSDWESCVTQASIAIMTANMALSLRQLRARCRFEKGEVQEGVNDLKHVVQLSPGTLDSYPSISSILFYSVGDTAQGLKSANECLRSDADYGPCKKVRRREKQLSKSLEKVQKLMEKGQFNSAAKLLAGVGEEPGLLAEIKEDTAMFQEAGFIPPKSPSGLYTDNVERVCHCFRETKSFKKADPVCAEALTLNPTSLHGLLHKAKQQLDAEDFDSAIATLNEAKEHHPESQKVQQSLQEAQVLLKRSKQKDYYKILGVDRDAEDRAIKRAYRSLVKQYHPDKAGTQGMTKEQAEKKMAAINEAYEVLIDPELRAKFDQGEDPNDPMAQQGGHPFQGSPFGGQQFFFQQGGFPGGGGAQFKFQHGGGGGFPFGGFPG